MRTRWLAFGSLVLVLGGAVLLWPRADRVRGTHQRTKGATAATSEISEPIRVRVSAPSTETPENEAPTSEQTFLRRLEELNRTDKPAALAWAERGETWYGGRGALAEARQAMKITLLVDLDRMADARAEVRRFIVAHPDSRYRPLVQGVTGIHPRPGRPILGPP